MCSNEFKRNLTNCLECEQLSNYVLLITLAPTKMKYTWRRIKDVQCNILYEVFEFEECLHICNTGYINVRRGCISWQWLSMYIYFQIGRLFCFILPGSDYCIMFHHVIACCVILVLHLIRPTYDFGSVLLLV